MTLEELWNVVTSSEPGDWRLVPTGGSDGPTYLYSLGNVDHYDDGKIEHAVSVESQMYRATLRTDISVGLAWGLSESDDDRYFPWLEHMADRSCTVTVADFIFNGSLVDRSLGLVVDGGRVYLPFPSAVAQRHGEGFNDVEIIGERVTPSQRKLWRLIDRLVGHSKFDGYFDQAGFVEAFTDDDE